MVASQEPIDPLMQPFTYRPSADESISYAVVAAVASVSDCRPTKPAAGDSADVLPPLYEAIDPDALDALFRRSDRSMVEGAAVDGPAADTRDADALNVDAPNADGPKRVAFSYHGFRVTVRSDGSVTVESE